MMNKMSDLKILICGDVNGNFLPLFSKVNAILKKKGPFEYLLCVGNFFGHNADQWEDVKSGKISVPLTTYVLGANEHAHEKFYTSSDLAPNIVYLGKRGCLTGSSGLRIAYLSGIEQLDFKNGIHKNNKYGTNSDSFTRNSIFFSMDDINDVINSLGSETVDILLTSQWPKSITKYAVSLDKDASSAESSSLISYLAKELKPRYHFCGLAGTHYERVPYRNHTLLQEQPRHVTRFFALAPVNNVQKQKWLYAFNITPACSLSHKQLTDTLGPATNCPYDTIESLNHEKSENQFFYDTSKPDRGKPQNPAKKRCVITSSKCWFCLSNSDVEKQLIISIGSHCYITLPKGVLVPEHVLIVPINHAVSSIELSDAVSEEVERFKKSLGRYFHDKGKDVVFFERNYSSPHLQIQAVPVPKQLKSEIKDALYDTAKHYDLEFSELSNFSHIQQIVSPKKPYFYFEIMINMKTEEKYLHVIDKKFPLQFGREVLASSDVLDVIDRIDWRKCQDVKGVEIEMAGNIRRSFEPYDLT